MCSQLYLTAQAGRSPQARSECPYYCAFQYKSSLNSTHTMPCTNTPVLFPVPGCTQSLPGKLLTAIWKYNMPQHICMHHPGYSVNGFEDGTLLPDLLHVMDISREEEKALGIPEGAIPTLKRTDILSASAPGQPSGEIESYYFFECSTSLTRLLAQEIRTPQCPHCATAPDASGRLSFALGPKVNVYGGAHKCPPSDCTCAANRLQ